MTTFQERRMQSDLRERLNQLAADGWTIENRTPITLGRLGTKYKYTVSPQGLVVGS